MGIYKRGGWEFAMPKLIPNWKRGLRMFSVQAQLIATGLLTGWGTLPQRWQDQIPVSAILGMASVVLAFGIIGRLVQQPALLEPDMTNFESQPKAVAETRRLVADFVGRLASGVTISSASVSQSVYSGASSTVTLGSASISGSTVSAAVSGGTAGVLYQVTFQATLSNGEVLRMATILAVTPDAV